MAKRLVKQPKHGHWNVKCGNFEYIHQYACEYLIHFVSLAGARVSCRTTAQTKMYLRKLVDFKKLVDIITMAIAALETSVLKVLNDEEIDE